MKTKIKDDSFIINDKEYCRYEIYIEAYSYKNSMRFSVKRNKNLDKEFKAAVEMCREENKIHEISTSFGIYGQLYKAVKCIDRATCKIIKEVNL